MKTKVFVWFIKISPTTDVSNVLVSYLQIVLENSAGAIKIKVVEYGGDKTLEELNMPDVVNILESELLISVSI